MNNLQHSEISIVQYYKSQSEILDLVKSVKQISMKKAQFLISDIVVSNDKITKYPKLIYHSLLEGYFFSLFNLSLKLILDKKYSNVERKQPILIVNLERLINDLFVLARKVTIIDQILTVNPDRKHLLIQF